MDPLGAAMVLFGVVLAGVAVRLWRVPPVQEARRPRVVDPAVLARAMRRLPPQIRDR
jgi:hypothetical protein